MINQYDLKLILKYHKSTGIFTWKDRSNRSKKKGGDEAGSLSGCGYIDIKINGFSYKAHRLAWLYVYGSFPEKNIDHKNGIRHDNRWRNLREATPKENMWNRSILPNNKTGRKGVSIQTINGKYRAHARWEGKQISLGVYETIEEAGNAYHDFAKNNHGEFYKE